MMSLDILEHLDFCLSYDEASERADPCKARAARLEGAALNASEGLVLLLGRARECIETVAIAERRMEKLEALLDGGGLPERALESLDDAEMLARASIGYMKRSARATRKLLKRTRSALKRGK